MVWSKRMIMKITDEKDLFTIMDSDEEREWYKSLPIQPLSLQIVGLNYMFLYSEAWNKHYMGNDMWMKFKQ